jgi:acyl carrier protein
MSRSAIENLVCDFLKVAPHSIAEDQVLARLTGWDSIKFMHIIFSLEKQLHVRFEAHEVVAVKTWGDFLNLAERKQQATSV